MTGLVDNVLILEREAYEIFITQITDIYTIEKKVQFVLLDYKNKRTVDAIKITTKDGIQVIVVSEMLTY